MEEFLSNIIGELTVAKFAAAFVFALIGIFLSLLHGTTKRNPYSKRTPFSFSWSFFWNDNTKRILKSVVATLLIVFIGLRFARELFGVEVSMFFSLLLGVGIDKVFERIKMNSDKQNMSQPNLPS